MLTDKRCMSTPARVDVDVCQFKSNQTIQCIVEILVDLHNRCLITAAIAVVGRGKYGDDLFVLGPLIPL